MKVSVFENQFTRERYVCQDISRAELIEGEEYLRVQRWLGSGARVTEQLNQREFLMKRAALKKVKA
jgi:hypothetical protein